jgi:hypothetical protein
MHLEPATVDQQDDATATEPADREADVDQHVNVEGELTDESADEGGSDRPTGDAVDMGGLVEVDGVKWRRVEAIAVDTREEFPDFDLQVRNHSINDHTKEKVLFDVCMPLKNSDLLKVLRCSPPPPPLSSSSLSCSAC